MSMSKVAVTIESSLLTELDKLVKQQRFPNRSKAIQEALEEKLARMRHERFEEELAKLDPAEEQAFAEEGMALELDRWPEY